MQTYRTILFLVVLVAATVGWAKVGQLAEAQEPEQPAIDPDAWVAVAYVPELVKLWPALGEASGVEPQANQLTTRPSPSFPHIKLMVDYVELVRVEEDGTVKVRAKHYAGSLGRSAVRGGGAMTFSAREFWGSVAAAFLFGAGIVMVLQ